MAARKNSTGGAVHRKGVTRILGNAVVSQKFHTKKVAASAMRSVLARQVGRFERRYEMPSAHMAQHVGSGRVRETAEVLKWMQGYRALDYLKRGTPTTGTHTTTTARSKRSASKRTRS